VKRYHAAEPDGRVARMKELSDAELMRVAAGHAAKTNMAFSRLLTVRSR
jgi:hypothetical protein